MRRYWLDGLDVGASDIMIDGDTYHHIFIVCRQQVGSQFELLGGGREALSVEVLHVHKKSAHVKVLGKRVLPQLKKPHIHLCLSVPKIDTFERVLEKSVELGVQAIHPFFSEYSFFKSSNSLFTKKRKRFDKILIGATQQTGRSELMRLESLCTMTELTKKYAEVSNARKVGLFAYEGESKQEIYEAFSESSPEGSQPSSPSEIWLFVGSEGGFSQSEVDLFHGLGLKSTGLGDQVLRVETACVALVSVIKYNWKLF